MSFSEKVILGDQELVMDLIVFVLLDHEMISVMDFLRKFEAKNDYGKRKFNFI